MTMSQPQLAYDAIEVPPPMALCLPRVGNEPQSHVPIWQRRPDEEWCSFEYRPATARNERDDHFWECRRLYVLSHADYNWGITDNDIVQLKRVMIEALSAMSGGVLTERDWKWTFYFRIIDLCGEQCLDCWLE